MAVFPLFALYLLDWHLTPAWVLPSLERVSFRELSIAQGQEELIVENISIPEDSPLLCCSEGNLDLDLTFGSARLAPSSAETFRMFLIREPPGDSRPIRYFSHTGEPAGGEPCRTKIKLYAIPQHGANLQTLRFSQPEPPPSNLFRLLRIQLTDRSLTTSLLSTSGPGAGMPGLICRKRLQIENTLPWDFFAPMGQEIAVDSGSQIQVQLERLQSTSPGSLWLVNLLQGVEAESVRIVDSANREKIAFEDRPGGVKLRIRSLAVGADRMVAGVEVPSALEGFKARKLFVGSVTALLLAVNVALVALGGSLALFGFKRPPSSLVRVFVSYSRKDEGYLKDISLLGFLEGLKREGIEFWIDRKMLGGEKWKEKIFNQIGRSDIGLLLVSQSYLDSDICNKEVRAFDKEKILVPVILSPCEWRRHDWLEVLNILPGNDETLKEHYQDAGRRERFIVDILRDTLRQRAVEVRRKKGVLVAP